MEIKTRLQLKRGHLTNETFEERWIRVDELDEVIDRLYNKYIVPDNGNVPKVLIQGINHPISAMRGELKELLK